MILISSVHNALGVSLICVQRWDEMVACVKKTVELMCQLMAIGILDSPSEGLETIIACHYKSVETPKRKYAFSFKWWEVHFSKKRYAFVCLSLSPPSSLSLPMFQVIIG